ncbi:equistatin-like isoform X2 [Anneissia japonica]|uniref:equistatin-like isoform X2 n=1 Tax=Anneissia japonica TaxID=1529436 RepID=UPI001425526E|nr:equistatin-like isoform X2 [Anneissia japonica]
MAVVKTIFVLTLFYVVLCTGSREVQRARVSKEGRCPDVSQNIGSGVCSSDCSNDLDCHDDMKCCSSDCGQYTCAQPVDEVVCEIPCPRIYQPVCGTDGETYSSECILNFTTCTRNQQFVQMLHDGPCTENDLNNRENQASGPCAIELEKVMGSRKMPLIGAKIPQCDNEGYYKAKQCWGSVGMCWCSDRNGNEMSKPKRGKLTMDYCLLMRGTLKPSP